MQATKRGDVPSFHRWHGFLLKLKKTMELPDSFLDLEVESGADQKSWKKYARNMKLTWWLNDLSRSFSNPWNQQSGSYLQAQCWSPCRGIVQNFRKERHERREKSCLTVGSGALDVDATARYYVSATRFKIQNRKSVETEMLRNSTLRTLIWKLKPESIFSNLTFHPEFVLKSLLGFFVWCLLDKTLGQVVLECGKMIDSYGLSLIIREPGRQQLRLLVPQIAMFVCASVWMGTCSKLSTGESKELISVLAQVTTMNAEALSVKTGHAWLYLSRQMRVFCKVC